MNKGAFSKYHPVINILFFIFAICFGVVLQHPVYLLSAIVASGSYYLILNGKNGLKSILMIIPLFGFIALFNPIVNTRGDTVLFLFFGRPYTFEALIYGVVVATVFVVMMLWCGCYNKVVTGDKFACVFGNIIPTISLLLVMVFRMIPDLTKKAKQIAKIRESIGKGYGEGLRDKLLFGISILSVLTSMALEGSVTTGDSMRARGYGTKKRTSFMIYSMKMSDWILLSVMLVCISVVMMFLVKGYMSAQFFPRLDIKRTNLFGFITYFGYLMIPTVIHIKEKIQWNISRYKI